tara:strand:+ start:129 stop:248 length:120 start_codon:yes stop_codon:yes gene_type:complete
MLKVKNSKAFKVGVMLSYNEKKELQQASANNELDDPDDS